MERCRRRSRPPRVGPYALVACALGACEGSTGPSEEIVRLTLDPIVVTLPEPGAKARLDAVGVTAAGTTRVVSPVWSSADESVAVIDQSGLLTATGRGSTAVQARLNGLSALATVTVDPDTVAPTLHGLSIDRTRVDVLNKPGSVRVWIDLRDDRAGVGQAVAQFQSPAGASITGVVTMTLLSGSAHAGRYEGFLGIPANAALGRWALASVRAEDEAGNVAIWREAELAALGLAATFETVWGGGGA